MRLDELIDGLEALGEPGAIAVRVIREEGVLEYRPPIPFGPLAPDHARLLEFRADLLWKRKAIRFPGEAEAIAALRERRGTFRWAYVATERHFISVYVEIDAPRCFACIVHAKFSWSHRPREPR